MPMLKYLLDDGACCGTSSPICVFTVFILNLCRVVCVCFCQYRRQQRQVIALKVRVLSD